MPMEIIKASDNISSERERGHRAMVALYAIPN
jgi:hypothetical protein